MGMTATPRAPPRGWVPRSAARRRTHHQRRPARAPRGQYAPRQPSAGIALPPASLVDGTSTLPKRRAAARSDRLAAADQPRHRPATRQRPAARRADRRAAGRGRGRRATTAPGCCGCRTSSLGTDYFAHTGPQQTFAGDIVKSNRNTFMAGLGPNVVFAFSDAVYAPLAARQELRARQADQQAAINDSTLAGGRGVLRGAAGPRRTGRRRSPPRRRPRNSPARRPTAREGPRPARRGEPRQGRTRPPQAGGRRGPRALAHRQRRTRPRCCASTRPRWSNRPSRRSCRSR